jgi:uncharacterized protein (AIM24 family)
MASQVKVATTRFIEMPAEGVLAVVVRIDNKEYEVPFRTMTGRELKSLLPTDTGSEVDLYEVAQGGDILVQNELIYALADGMNFFTAPSYWS